MNWLNQQTAISNSGHWNKYISF